MRRSVCNNYVYVFKGTIIFFSTDKMNKLKNHLLSFGLYSTVVFAYPHSIKILQFKKVATFTTSNFTRTLLTK